MSRLLSNRDTLSRKFTGASRKPHMTNEALQKRAGVTLLHVAVPVSIGHKYKCRRTSRYSNVLILKCQFDENRHLFFQHFLTQNS